MPVLSQDATAALRRLQAILDEMERLGTEARALMAELCTEDAPSSDAVRERTREALRQLRQR